MSERTGWRDSFPILTSVPSVKWEKLFDAMALRNEAVVRELLGQWVSEIEPVVFWYHGEIVGIGWKGGDTPDIWREGYEP